MLTLICHQHISKSTFDWQTYSNLSLGVEVDCCVIELQ